MLDLDTARDAADFSIAFLHCPEYRLTRTMSLDHPKTVVREARLFQEFVRGFAFARAAILDFYWCELHGVVHSEMCDRPEGCHRIYRGEPCLS